MQVTIALEHRFERLPNGSVWRRGPFGTSFFERYLAVFSSVQVLARAKAVDEPTPGAQRADGAGIRFLNVPYYEGPREYLWKRRAVIAAAVRALRSPGAVILRAPSQLANCLEPVLRAQRRPYGVEVVGDPWDALAPGSYPHPLRAAMRLWYRHRLRRQCVGAMASAYVTHYTLQRRYPPRASAFSTCYSSVELPPEAYVEAARPESAFRRPPRLVAVGSLENFYKGPDTLLEALAMARRENPGWTLRWIGDGLRRRELEQRARALNLGECVVFAGALPTPEAVRAELDGADVMVLPSRAEGLPQALLEAMARALPCVGSAVGGVPEALGPEFLTPPGDAAALARKLAELMRSPARLAAASAENLVKSRKYRESELAARRKALYEQLARVTARWEPVGEGAGRLLPASERSIFH